MVDQVGLAIAVEVTCAKTRKESSIGVRVPLEFHTRSTHSFRVGDLPLRPGSSIRSAMKDVAPAITVEIANGNAAVVRLISTIDRKDLRW